MKRFPRSAYRFAAHALASTAILFASVARADNPPAGWTASNVELVGYTIMNEHPAFKITMTRAGDRCRHEKCPLASGL